MGKRKVHRKKFYMRENGNLRAIPTEIYQLTESYIKIGRAEQTSLE